MRLLITGLFITLLLTLSGCKHEPASSDPSLSGAGISGIIGFGTLADSNNPFDMAGSVVATKVAMTAYLAEKKFRAGTLPIDQAQALLSGFKQTSAMLKKAVADKDMDAIQTVSDTINIEYVKLEAMK